MPDPLAGLGPRFLRTPEAARFLSLSGRTLEKHRTYGTGPKYRKIGGRVVYALEDLKAWADMGAKTSTSDPGAGTVFRIASMTKSFTAAAVLALRDDGRLALDDPAEEFVPELRGHHEGAGSVARGDASPVPALRVGLPDWRVEPGAGSEACHSSTPAAEGAPVPRP